MPLPLLLLLVLSFVVAPEPAHAQVVKLAWDTLPPLPPASGETRQPGVASPFTGVQGDVLLVAGGANFPGRMPWDGGAKVWWDDIWVLEKRSDGAFAWATGPAFKLPRRLGYGVGVGTPAGVVCIGGSDAERCYADVFLLAWDAAARAVRTTPFPSLPEPLANLAGALVGDAIYVAGGQHAMKGAVASAAFWRLDLAKRDRPAEFKWEKLPTWPGPPRVLPVAAAQQTDRGPGFFLFSGRVPRPGQPTELLTDAYAFDPGAGTWRALPAVNGGAGVCVMAGTAAPAGNREILIFGGDRGELFAELEAQDLAIEALRRKIAELPAGERAPAEQEIELRLTVKRKIYENHPGFGREVYAFDVRRETWRVVASSPLAPQVTTTAVRWGDAIVIPSGEIRPGVRTPEIVRVTPALR
jgi:cyclically-permuted mutarotase family protein